MKGGHVWLASFFVFPIVGAPLVGHRAFRPFGLLGRLILATGVGMVLLSWTMTAFALAGVRWGPLLVLAAALAAFALRRVLRDFNPPLPARAGEGEGEGAAVARIAHAITAVAVLAAFLATAAARSSSPDLAFFWGAKAQRFAAARTIDAEFLGAPDLEYLHVYYPPLVTNVFAFAAMAAGRFPWGAATLTFPLFLAATAAGLERTLRTREGRAPAAAATALAVSALALIGIHAAVAGNAEPFLLFFEALAVALLATHGRSVPGQLLAGLFFAGVATSKVEGVPFVAAAAVMFLFVERRSARPFWRTLLLLLGPSIVALGSWFSFGAARGLFRGYKGYGDVLGVRWENLPDIVNAVGLALWKTAYALPWLVPIAILLLVPGKTRRTLLPAGIAIAIAGFILFTYLTTAGDPRLLISWSAARVLSPVAALLAVASFGARGAR